MKVKRIRNFKASNLTLLLFGLFLGFGGIVYLIAATTGISTSSNDFLGSALIVAGALSWGGGAVYSRVANVPRSPMLSSGMELILGGVLVLIASFIIGEPVQFQLNSRWGRRRSFWGVMTTSVILSSRGISSGWKKVITARRTRT